MDLRENYKKKIEEIPNTSFNKDQKELAIKILDICEEKDLENIYKLLVRRVKTGFVFDSAPSSNNQSIALLQYNEKLSLNDLNKNKKPFDEQGLTNDNLLIIGENYDALKNLLLVYRNKIDIIYIDPPYNTDASINEKNNYSEDEIKEKSSTKFVYRDKFSRTGWLNMMQDRLYLAKDLLSEDGVIFVSIDDGEQAYLKVLMDEIFGEENFICNFTRETTPHRPAQEKYANNNSDYILSYCKNKKISSFKKIISKKLDGKIILKDNIGDYIQNDTKSIKASKSQGYVESLDYDFEYNGKIYSPILKDGTRWRWTWNKERLEKAKQLGILRETKNGIRQQIYLNCVYEEKTNELKYVDNTKMIINTNEFCFIENVSNNVGTEELFSIVKNDLFDYPKPKKLILYLINLINKKDTIVLDFFSGSGTTAQSVMELNEEDNGNRKFILVTNNAEIIKDKKPTGKFIATDVTYERLHRITKGVGTKGEKNFAWIKERKGNPYKTNNLKVFDIVYKDTTIHSNWNEIKEEVKKSFRLLDENFKIQDEDFVYKLSSLHPYKEEKKEE